MNRGTMAVIAVSVFLVVWYAVAHIYNLRRGRRLRQWLEAGLDDLGGKRETGWIGSPASGARFTLRGAKAPFKRMEITLLLENREIPILWLLDYLRDRRDRLIMRATLRTPRRGRVQVRSKVPSEPKAGSSMWKQGPHGLMVAYQGPNGDQMAAALDSWLRTYGSQIQRLHWSKHDPHVTLQLRIAGLLETKAETLLSDLAIALQTNRQS